MMGRVDRAIRTTDGDRKFRVPIASLPPCRADHAHACIGGIRDESGVTSLFRSDCFIILQNSFGSDEAGDAEKMIFTLSHFHDSENISLFEKLLA